jgi:epoxyqueuosine reductase
MPSDNTKNGAYPRTSGVDIRDPIVTLREEAKKEGFIAMGFSNPDPPPFFDRFKTWLAEGKNGDMKWLERYTEIRADPRLLLECCRHVISLAYPYSSKKPSTPDSLTAARFTEPQKRDYHLRIRERAENLANTLHSFYPGSTWRVCVDSAPILERSFAYGSGIGFIGKNNMLIIPGHGSYLFLAEILTTAKLPVSGISTMENMCGECRLCIEACPTGALAKPFSLNSTKCLSYLTVEYKGNVRPETGRKMGNCFFGCDACQEICPFNRENPGREISLPLSEDILEMSKKEFKRHFGKTAFSRVGLEKLQSSIMAVRKNGSFP